MKYESPYCPWCPGSIRAWREGQPHHLLSSLGDPRPPLGFRSEPGPEPQTTEPAHWIADSLTERIADIIALAKRKGYRRIGIATCGASERAAEALSATLGRAGFEVIWPAALQQALAASERWLPALVDSIPPAEPGCNPAGQAELLNAGGSDLNVTVGMCAGCDSIFFRLAKVPTTVLAAGGRTRAAHLAFVATDA